MITGVSSLYRDDIAVIWIHVQGCGDSVFAAAAKCCHAVFQGCLRSDHRIFRAGMSMDQFAALAGSTWGASWTRRGGWFLKFPITAFRSFLDELSQDRGYDNVIFTNG